MFGDSDSPREVQARNGALADHFLPPVNQLLPAELNP
jgi:hypothetical protein